MVNATDLEDTSAESRETQFCAYCGTRLDRGAKFCKGCGKPVIQHTEKTQNECEDPEVSNEGTAKARTERKTVYEGALHKCPNCGEVLNAFVANCPSCGYEIRGTITSDSVKEFSLKIEQASSDEQKVTLIRNFPISNTKEDIFEFMILASTNIRGEQDKSAFDAWVVKFEQSYQKAKLLFETDPDFKKIELIYNQSLDLIERQKVMHSTKTVGGVLTEIAAAIPNPVFGIVAAFLCMFELMRLISGRFAGIDIIFSAIVLGSVYKITTGHSTKGHRSDAGRAENAGGKATVNHSRGAMRQGVDERNDDEFTRPSMKAYAEEPAKVKVPSKAFDESQQNFAVVESLFIQAGFTNVRVVPLRDLTIGMLKKPGTIDSITINGKELSSYFRRRFSPNVSVIISYHSLR